MGLVDILISMFYALESGDTVAYVKLRERVMKMLKDQDRLDPDEYDETELQ